MIGATLGHYRIDARLGAGGMGVVYRARDERLHRIVAIKLLGTDKQASLPEHRDRLLEEARAASHLNHPHICTVYEVGDIDGQMFIAMEFVEGRALSQIVPADGLPTETVIRYGEQIADALAHAHERGVVHRDLKTSNIAVNPGSGAKVLDFGLARRSEIEGVVINTRSVEMADPGVLVGTLAYIAPEILLGQGSDARSDIWGLGVVLYEMATGQLPFQGRSEFELTAAILRSPPLPFPADVPPILRSIILRCMAKEPAQRYQRAGEARAALEAIKSDLIVATPAAPAPEPPDPARRGGINWKLTGAALVALAALTAWLLLRDRGGADRVSTPGAGRLVRVVSSENRTFDPAISADGRMLAYVAEDPPGQLDLYAGRISGGARIKLTNDLARESAPRFSPDGEQVAYTVAAASGGPSQVNILPALGGAPVATIANAADAAWSPDGRRLVYLRQRTDGEGSELAISTLDGSDLRSILRADAQYPFLRHPAWSPDGETIAVVRGSGGIAGELWLVPAKGGSPRQAIRESGPVSSDWPNFTRDGRGLVHASNRGGATNIWWLPLAGGSPVQLTTGAGPDESPSIGLDNTIAYVNSRWRNTLEVHDLRKGISRTLLTHSPFVWGPAVSPDGSEVTVSRSDVDGSWHLVTVPFAGGNARQVTSSPAGEVYARYSADGAAIFFHSWSGPRKIGRVSRTGGTITWLGFDQPGAATFADVSPDGKTIAFVSTVSDTEQIFTAPVAGGRARRLTSSRATLPRWSPDGTKIAFTLDRRFDGGIWMVDADGKSEHRVTKEGGWPVWWPDGTRIGYLALGADGNAQIRVLTLATGATRTLDSIKLRGVNHPFAVSPDGEHVVSGNALHDQDEIWVIEPRR
jgi:eukaryotic-like serine/threonine-protein kinase